MMTGKDKIPPDKPPDQINILSDVEMDTTGAGDTRQAETTTNLTMKYLRAFKGPYVIVVENTDGTPLHDLKLGKLMFTNNSINDVLKIDHSGRQRVSITFKNASSANDFLSHPLLARNNMRAFIPQQLVKRVGVIRNIPIDVSEEDIKNNIQSWYKILAVERLKRRVQKDNVIEYAPTQSFKVTFYSQNLPDSVQLYLANRRVEPFIFRVTQCETCLRYGHTTKSCKSGKPRCGNCGSTEHGTQNCTETQPTCVHCKGPYKAIDTKCPEFERQKIIKRAMAEQSISYRIANEKFPPVHIQNSFNLLSDFPSLPEKKSNAQSSYAEYRHKPANNGRVNWFEPKDWSAKAPKNKIITPNDPRSKLSLPNQYYPTLRKLSITEQGENPHKTPETQKFISEIEHLLTC